MLLAHLGTYSTRTHQCKVQSSKRVKGENEPCSSPFLSHSHPFFSLFWFPSFAFFEFDPHPLFRFVSLSSNFCFSFPDNSAISACETAVCCCGIAPVQRSAGDELKLASSSSAVQVVPASAGTMQAEARQVRIQSSSRQQRLQQRRADTPGNRNTVMHACVSGPGGSIDRRSRS